MTTPFLQPPPPARNLVPGQYQIGKLIFGRGTTVPVETFDIKPYDVNAQDYQITRADEVRFGWDQLKPTTIEITFHVLNNHLLPGFENLIPHFWEEMPIVDDFQREWKFDEGRYVWGAMKPLYVCGRDGITRMVWGRPGQFTYAPNTPYTEAVQCLGVIRRADTISYGIAYNILSLNQGQLSGAIHSTDGNAPSWIRIFLHGPITNPMLTFTNLFNQAAPVVYQLNRTVAADETIELDGEPWTRRVVSTTGQNVAADLTDYLDKLRFYCESTVGVNLAGTGMSGTTQALIMFRDAYQTV